MSVSEAGTPPEEGQGDEGSVEAPQEGQAQEVNYEQQYNELRPEYTRTTQELAQHRQFMEMLADPSTQAEALAYLGLDLEDEETEEEDLDPVEELRQRLEGVEGTLTNQQQLEQQQELEEMSYQVVDEGLDYIEQNIGRKFSDEEADLIGNLAFQMQDENGVPNVQAAYQHLDKYLEGQRQSWIDSKKSANRVYTGAQGSKEPNLDDKQQRQDYMAERLRSLAEDG